MSKSLSAPFRHVQTPTEIFDYWLPILGHVELKVLMIIVRQTFGWHKIRDRIPLSQLVEKTGSNRTNVCDAIQELIKHNLIKKTIEGVSGSEKIYYELIFEDRDSAASTPPPSQIDTPPSTKLVPPPVPNWYPPPSTKLVPSKETTLTKETKEKEKKEKEAKPTDQVNPQISGSPPGTQEKEAKPTDQVNPQISGSPPGTQEAARQFFLPFSKNEEKYVKRALEKKGYSEQESARGIEYALKTEFWLKTIKSCDGFIKSFETILGQSPKVFEKMSEEEQFKKIIRQINEKEPLSKFHIVLHMDSRTIEEKHYKIFIPMDIGPLCAYNRIMSLYNGTYWTGKY